LLIDSGFRVGGIGIPEIVLSTDRTLMSHHHHKEFLGFGTTAAPVVFPEFVWLELFAPRMKADKNGLPWQAPYGLRKIEAKLKSAGYEADVVLPEKLDEALVDAKILLISHHDYFGFGPPSSTFASIFGRETVNARSFKRFMNNPAIAEAKKRGLKIIAGGPAAWQWRHRENLMKQWGIDCVFDGEGERIIVDLVKKAINGGTLPKYVEMSPADSPTLEEIPCIMRPSVNGLVEIMRGCPRGCKFCSVTHRPLRFIPMDRIEQEMKLNHEAGVKCLGLHSEDVLLYGGTGIIPNAEKVIELNRVAKKYSDHVIWAHASIAAIVKGERESKLISRVAEVLINDKQKWWGAEIGVETGSVPLARNTMPQKAKPYAIEQWPELVIEAAGIMQDVNMIPAMTVIAGLPDEKEEDVLRTMDLIDDLWDFKSIIMPMFFVPMGMLSNEDWFKAFKLSDTHILLLKRCLSHGALQGRNILKEYFSDRWYGSIISTMYFGFLSTIEVIAKHKGYWSEPEKTSTRPSGESSGTEHAQ